MAQKKAASGPSSRALPVLTALTVLASGLASQSAEAQNFPISPAQRSTAQQVARAGVPLSELAPNAPAEYTVKRGDTLWAISRLFLRNAWRWPELWGMNIDEIRNPHLIYPGQRLVLEKIDGMALLRLRPDGSGTGSMPTDTIRVTPRIRYEGLADAALPTLQANLLEPFLAEPLIVDELTLERAPRIVGTQDGRVLITRGDRAYARGPAGAPLVERDPSRAAEEFRVFRNARPLRDPVTKVILGYEAQFLGKALLQRSESVGEVQNRSGAMEATIIPATIDIVAAKEEMRVGDRLLPEPARQLLSYVPRAPERPVEGTIVSMYGDAVMTAGQNQIVVINKGTADGIQSGHVLAILRSGAVLVDRTQAGERTTIKLPDERTGLLMVFRPFERLSYALVLEITNVVQAGDKVINPR